MGEFIAKQPNGRLCRFSTVVDTITHYNMTENDYIELCAEQAREEARFRLEEDKRFIKPFERIKEYFTPLNNTQQEFDDICSEMEKEVTSETKIQLR